MASGWMKSLHCKSRAFDDVVDHSSCRNSFQSLKDIVDTTKKPKPKKPKRAPSPPFKRPVSRRPDPDSDFRPGPVAAQSFFPSLTELPKDHPSRNVVEIIFHTSWGEKSFPGRVEMVFKVQNLNRTLTRFEEYRDSVKRRAGGDHARCIADGNEVMRFYCLGAYEAGGGAWSFKRAAVCTYSGSGVAHERAGGGRGRRAMLVCRVVAGRVRKQHGFDSLIQERVGFDSVSGENGELLVFDTRALLPCFLIIYNL
ncbi:hypothetical protein ACS0TY_001431 [Phlomoides rotata]